MIFWSLCAFIWFRNMKKLLLQMTSVSLQPVPSLIFVDVHFLSKLSRAHSKSSNNDFAKFKQCERVILRLG
jgi:hypothetical protein